MKAVFRAIRPHALTLTRPRRDNHSHVAVRQRRRPLSLRYLEERHRRFTSPPMPTHPDNRDVTYHKRLHPFLCKHSPRSPMRFPKSSAQSSMEHLLPHKNWNLSLSFHNPFRQNMKQKTRRRRNISSAFHQTRNHSKFF